MFTLLWFCKPIACNLLAQVAESMTNSCLRAVDCSNNLCRSWLNIGSWNLHLLVESVGSVATASTRKDVQVDRMVNLLVGELHCFDMSTTGISKTKWFGIMR